MSNASLKEQLQAFAAKKMDAPAKDTQAKPQKQHNANRHRETAAKKPKPKWLEYAQYGVELLRVYFPAAFKEMNAVQPLKKGIKEDLIRRLSTIENIVTEDKACMVKSLSYYVNTAFYHKTVVTGAVRIDLDGQPAGTVTAEEAQYSVDRNQAKQQAKQQASHKSQASQHNKEKELVT
jgi:ProP effector